MKSAILVLAICMISGPCSQPVLAEDDKEAKEAALSKELEKTIAEAIRLLESKEYETYLKTLLPPKIWAAVQKDTERREFVINQLKKGSADRTLKMLKPLQDLKAKFTDNGKRAVFTLPGKEPLLSQDDNRLVIFVKIEDAWRIDVDENFGK